MVNCKATKFVGTMKYLDPKKSTAEEKKTARTKAEDIYREKFKFFYQGDYMQKRLQEKIGPSFTEKLRLLLEGAIIGSFHVKTREKTGLARDSENLGLGREDEDALVSGQFMTRVEYHHVYQNVFTKGTQTLKLERLFHKWFHKFSRPMIPILLGFENESKMNQQISKIIDQQWKWEQEASQQKKETKTSPMETFLNAYLPRVKLLLDFKFGALGRNEKEFLENTNKLSKKERERVIKEYQFIKDTTAWNFTPQVQKEYNEIFDFVESQLKYEGLDDDVSTADITAARLEAAEKKKRAVEIFRIDDDLKTFTVTYIINFSKQTIAMTFTTSETVVEGEKKTTQKTLILNYKTGKVIENRTGGKNEIIEVLRGKFHDAIGKEQTTYLGLIEKYIKKERTNRFWNYWDVKDEEWLASIKRQKKNQKESQATNTRVNSILKRRLAEDRNIYVIFYELLKNFINLTGTEKKKEYLLKAKDEADKRKFLKSTRSKFKLQKKPLKNSKFITDLIGYLRLLIREDIKDLRLRGEVRYKYRWVNFTNHIYLIPKGSKYTYSAEKGENTLMAVSDTVEPQTGQVSVSVDEMRKLFRGSTSLKLSKAGRYYFDNARYVPQFLINLMNSFVEALKEI